LDKGEEEAATRLPARLRRGELGAQEPLLCRAWFEPAIAVPVDDRPGERRRRGRRGSRRERCQPRGEADRNQSA
jgi:hypothetical protein